MNKNKKVLFWDMETTYLQARIWRLGEQVVRHDQLVESRDRYDIICIAYAWNDGKPPKILHWDYSKQNSAKMVAEFDKIIRSADIVIGKNSDRFDNKQLNTLRMLHGQYGMPDWTKYTDDLEKQIRKHFYLPSNSLDYLSKLLGYGAKTKMEFDDWIDIVEKRKKGRIKFKKMLGYCKRDVVVTRASWNRVEEYVTPKLQYKTGCKNCGGNNLKKDGVRYQGVNIYQERHCNDCHRYAGRVKI